MADETITVRRDGAAGNNNGETVTVQRAGAAPATGETVAVRREAVPTGGQTVTVRRDEAPASGETVTVRRDNAPAVGDTVTVSRSAAVPATGETVTVSRNAAPASGQTVTDPRGADSESQTVTVSRVPEASPNGETVTVVRGGGDTAASSASPFVPEDVTIFAGNRREFIVHLGQVIGHGGQSTIVAAERVDDGLACVAKIFKPLVGSERVAYQKVVSAVMGLNNRPVAQTHLLPIFAYLHQGLSATELGAAAPQLWDVSITPLATCLSDRPRSTHMVKSRVIPELSQAIELLHTELGIVHRDIKPQNVYLYDKQIVLGDYGSARSLAGFDNRQTNTMTRSDGYTPGRGGMVDPRNDWYSFGYTIWTLYEGNVHPLQEFMDDGTLFDRLETGEPADFNHPDDATLGNLLQGLTFELSGERFGYEEVKDWIADSDHFYRKLPTMDAGSARKPYEFAGKSYSDPVLLARALASNWDEAKLRMSQKQLENLMGDWGENDLQTKIHQLVEEDIQTATNPDLAIACVIYEMSDGKIMSWRGEDVSLTSAAESLPARITDMGVDKIDRYALLSGLDGTSSSGVLPSGFISRILSCEKNPDSERARLASDIHDLELLARQSSDPHFAACLFKGLLTPNDRKHAVAQNALKSLLQQPSSFFDMCASPRLFDEFLLCFAGDVEMSSIISARSGATRDGSVDSDTVLDFIDKVADNHDVVRSFYRRFGGYAAWIWLAGNTDLYEALQGSTGEAAIIALRGLKPASGASVSTLIELGSNARLEGIKLRGDMEATPVPYVYGWQNDSRFGTRPATLDSLFCAQVGNDVVPRGYVNWLSSAGTTDEFLASRGIKFLADSEHLPSAAYSQFLEDARGVADGELKAAIERDTRDYGVVEGIVDSDARMAAVKKEQHGVLMYTVLIVLLYLVVLMCAQNAFGQLIVSLGAFGPLAIIFLAIAFIGCFGFLALNLLRSFSAVDRVTALKSDLDSNASTLEKYLVRLVEFDERTDSITKTLSAKSENVPLTDGCKLLFSTGSQPLTFYADPEVMDRFGRLAGRLVLIAALVTSAFGFMGPTFIDGDIFVKLDVFFAVCFGAMLVLTIFGEDAHPGSAKALRSWLYMWIVPIAIEFILSGVVSLANFLSIVGFIFLLLAFVISVVAFGFFRDMERGSDSRLLSAIAGQQGGSSQNVGYASNSQSVSGDNSATVNSSTAWNTQTGASSVAQNSQARPGSSRTSSSSSSSKQKKKKGPDTSGYCSYDGRMCRVDIYANYIKIVPTSMYVGSRDFDRFVNDVKMRNSRNLDKAFEKPFAQNAINIPANALTNFARKSEYSRYPEFTFDRKNRELGGRIYHTITVISPDFDKDLEEFGDTHYHYTDEENRFF